MRKEIEGIYDWSKHDGPTLPIRSPKEKVEIDDETLRDGLQGIQLETHPSIEAKKIYLLNSSQFVEHADIGYPGPPDEDSEMPKQELAELLKFVINKNLPITISLAGRASLESQEDIKPIVDLFNQVDGFPLEADIFWDSSKFRAELHKWNRTKMLKQVEFDIKYLKKEGLSVMFVPERSTDTPPNELSEILQVAADSGVDRIGIADTRGIADEDATRNILRFSFEQIGYKYPEIKWDFHGHRDTDHSTSNSEVAAKEGIDRIHATIFHLGERAGNTDLIVITTNLNEKGFRNDSNLSGINDFSGLISEVFHYGVSRNTPIYGENAFATASGIHASGVMAEDLTEREHNLYFAVAPEKVGRKARVEVGPFSGKSNVRFKLRELEIPETAEIVHSVLQAGKKGRGLLSDQTIRGIAESIIQNGHK